MKKSTFNYTKLKNHKSIWKHRVSNSYLVRKKKNGVEVKKTFDSLEEATLWRDFNKSNINNSKTSTLKEVVELMREKHFPILASSTRDIWERRYELLKQLEHLPMNEIKRSTITSFVERNVAYFKSEFYEGNARGRAKRCNLDNELNMFTTIFNWYKNSEYFEDEAQGLSNPVRTDHKKQGFIRAVPPKNRSITLDHALEFFEALKPLYRDLAMLQFLTAGRIGEVAGLQWNRVNFENGQLTIMETCQWDQSTKMFVTLNPHPKNKEARPVHMTKELREILMRRLQAKVKGSNFVFHVEGQPLNYSTIQVNYKGAQRKAGLPYTGTHNLRHGMAHLARKVAGGLDAVIAMTGHKDLKLADHYSKLDNDFQKEVSEKIMEVYRGTIDKNANQENVIQLPKKKIVE